MASASAQVSSTPKGFRLPNSNRGPHHGSPSPLTTRPTTNLTHLNHSSTSQPPNTSTRLQSHDNITKSQSIPISTNPRMNTTIISFDTGLDHERKNMSTNRITNNIQHITNRCTHTSTNRITRNLSAITNASARTPSSPVPTKTTKPSQYAPTANPDILNTYDCITNCITNNIHNITSNINDIKSALTF